MRYRLDEPIRLAEGITRNKQIWLEEIQPQEKGFLFTEKYRQVSLIKLFNLLSHDENQHRRTFKDGSTTPSYP